MLVLMLLASYVMFSGEILFLLMTFAIYTSCQPTQYYKYPCRATIHIFVEEWSQVVMLQAGYIL